MQFLGTQTGALRCLWRDLVLLWSTLQVKFQGKCWYNVEYKSHMYSVNGIQDVLSFDP